MLASKMADEDILIEGRPLSDFRVVDLKKELDKRGLSKSGSKIQLAERLKTNVLEEKTEEESGGGDYPGSQDESNAEENEFLKQYFEQKRQLLESQRDARKKIEEEEEENLRQLEANEKGEEQSVKKAAVTKDSGDGDHVKKQAGQVEEPESPSEEGMRPRSRSRRSDVSKDSATENNNGATKEITGDEEKGEGMTVPEPKPEEKRSSRRRWSRGKGDTQKDTNIEIASVKEVKETQKVDTKENAQTEQMSVDNPQVEEKVDKINNEKKAAEGSEGKKTTPAKKDESLKTSDIKKNNDKERSRQRASERRPVRSRGKKGSDSEEESKSSSSSSSRSSSRSPSGGSSNSSSRSPKQTKSKGNAKRSRPSRGPKDNESSEKSKVKVADETAKDPPDSPMETDQPDIGKKLPQPDPKKQQEKAKENVVDESKTTTDQDKKSAGKKEPPVSPERLEPLPAATVKTVSSSIKKRSQRSPSTSSSSSRSRSRSKSSSRSPSPPKKSSIKGNDRKEDVEKTEKKRQKGKDEDRDEQKRERLGDKDAHGCKAEPESPTKVKSESPTKVKKSEIEVKKEEVSMEVDDRSTADSSTVQSDGANEETAVEAKPARQISKQSDGDRGSTEDKQGDTSDKPARKRRWGSKTAKSTKKTTTINISTDSLKGLIPDIKPAALISDPILDLGNLDSTSMSENEDDRRDVKIKRTVVQHVDGESEDEEEAISGDDKKPPEKKNTEEKRTEPVKDIVKEPVVVRQTSRSRPSVSLETEEPEKARGSPSPARNPASNIIHVSNLVRPFTLLQLQELLKRTGTLVEGGFWIDKIKSHCYACFENEDQASDTRTALHGTRWPSSNPKILSVDFATQDEFQHYKVNEEGPPVAKPETKREPPARKRRESEKSPRDSRKREEQRKQHVREWDRDKIKQRSRSRSPRKSRSRSRERRRQDRLKERKEKKAEKKVEEEAPAKLLDDLFKKTKATPCIYWLPLTEEQIEKREQARKERQVEREKRKLELDAREAAEKKLLQHKSAEASKPSVGRSSGGKSRSPQRNKDQRSQRERERSTDKGRRAAEPNRPGRDRRSPPNRTRSRSRSRGPRRR